MTDEGTRLNKYLASCGVGSRRACDALVQEGSVAVNGEPCTNPATRVGLDDTVTVQGKRVEPKNATVLLFHKPRGLVCSKNDEFGRGTIYGIIPPKYSHLNHVGRLDQDSEGLLILTNDGELANRLTHPRHKIEKEYLVTLGSAFDNEILGKLTSGVHTPAGRASATRVKRLSPRRVSMVLETGLKRQIREMFKTLGFKVTRLERVRLGGLTAPDLPPGKWLHLEPAEVELLFGTPKKKR